MGGFASRHPIISTIIIIVLIAILGFVIVYFSLAIFTKHGESDTVPAVENMTYTQAVNLLHDRGFKVDIRDSIYSDDYKPGLVVEQFPKANSVVKPGRKIFLYINAVNPKKVIIDEDNKPTLDALKGYSYRNGLARLQELGFKNIKTVKVLGSDDCIVKILANGRVVKKMQQIPLNSRITIEVYDGRLSDIRDSLQSVTLYNDRMYDAEGESESYIESSEDYDDESAPEYSGSSLSKESKSGKEINEEESYEFIE